MLRANNLGSVAHHQPTLHASVSVSATQRRRVKYKGVRARLIEIIELVEDRTLHLSQRTPRVVRHDSPTQLVRHFNPSLSTHK